MNLDEFDRTSLKALVILAAGLLIFMGIAHMGGLL